MRLQMPHVTLARPAAKLLIAASLALAGGMSLSAGSAPVRLVGVSAQGNNLYIEASEPVAYVVSRPDQLTVLLELRNVSVANAANVLEHRDPIAAVSLEQGTPVDGKALARVRVSLARPYEYSVRSARNTIRLELSRATRSIAPAAVEPPVRAAVEAATAVAAPAEDAAIATVLDRVRASRTPTATTVTLGGNGRLTPADVSEATGQPRRLVLDFPNVTSRAPAQTTLDGPLVKRVRVSLNTREPLLTRVVMEVAPGATYHVERAGTDGGDLAVVFEPPQSASTIMLTAPLAKGEPVDVEPDIPLSQAIANAASITPKEDAAGPISALKTAPATPPAAAPAQARRGAAQSPRAVTAGQQPAATPPASAPPLPSGSVVLSGATDKKYTGNPITLDFSGADLRTVLKYFHEISGLSIIIDPSVPATPIDIVLTDIP
ncbi:MAG: type pilus assembly protein PilQ, partial [Acidobacteriota bacterium]